MARPMRENKDWVLNPDAMLITAVLIATLAATTYFTVPGGFAGGGSSYRGMGSVSGGGGGGGSFGFNATEDTDAHSSFGSANLSRNMKTVANLFFGFTATAFLLAMLVVIMLSIGCNHRKMLHGISFLLMAATAFELQAILIMMNVVHPVLHESLVPLMACFLIFIFVLSLCWGMCLCLVPQIPRMSTVPELANPGREEREE